MSRKTVVLLAAMAAIALARTYWPGARRERRRLKGSKTS
jgi:hypothetical protein